MHPSVVLLRQRRHQAMPLPAEPLPALARMMVFVDGENLVARYQAMLSSGRTPSHEVRHRPDVFAWSHGAVWTGMSVVLRATYYTYVVGNEETILETSNAIRALTFAQYNPPGHHLSPRLGDSLYPKVLRKLKNSRNPKGIDIQLTVDVLSNTYQNNLDVVYLVAADGDYAPLIAECQRQGKQVFVAALSSGLNPSLRVIADRFIDIDNHFVVPAAEGSA